MAVVKIPETRVSLQKLLASSMKEAQRIEDGAQREAAVEAVQRLQNAFSKTDEDCTPAEFLMEHFSSGGPEALVLIFT